MPARTIAFFPEAAFGPALNSVGVAQACEQLGHTAVFLTDPGMSGVYQEYGVLGTRREYVGTNAVRRDGEVLV